VGAGRGHVADLELERLVAAERPADETGHDVDDVALGDRLGEVRPTEGDPVEDVDVPPQGQLAVAAAGGPDAGDREPADEQEWLGIADPARRQPDEVTLEGVVDVERAEGDIDVEELPRIGRDCRLGQPPEDLDELVPPFSRDLEAGGTGVAAVAEEQRRAGLERRAEIEPAVAPARRADDVAELRSDDGWSAVVVHELRRDETHDPDRPRTAHDRRA